MKDLLGFVAAVVLIAVVLGTLFGVIACVGQRVEFITAEPEIEQLRRDLARVAAQRSEDAVGQATQWNQRIASKRRWNQVIFLRLWIPDGWERIKAIEIPE